MASFSLLFIFIEFISAWFLKQYRHYVDTSSYLIKMKSIFDRYAMAHYVVNETSAAEGDKKEGGAKLIEMLTKEIKWPDPHPTKKANNGFAQDAMESMAETIKSLSGAVRQQNQSDQNEG